MTPDLATEPPPRSPHSLIVKLLVGLFIYAATFVLVLPVIHQSWTPSELWIGALYAAWTACQAMHLAALIYVVARRIARTNREAWTGETTLVVLSCIPMLHWAVTTAALWITPGRLVMRNSWLMFMGVAVLHLIPLTIHAAAYVVAGIRRSYDDSLILLALAIVLNVTAPLIGCLIWGWEHLW